jgi:hypothetical protein
MNKSLIIASALVLASSSVAMADSFSFGAKASVSFGTPSSRVVVRDHRTQARPIYTRPVSVPQRYPHEYTPYQPAPIPANLDCRNWDPTVDTTDACNVYATGYTYAPQMRGPWQLLGVRESAVPVGQFITVADGRVFDQLKIRAELGAPVITKIAVSFMDGSTQVTNLGGQLDRGTTRTINLRHRAVNQVVIYTANGSRGTYSIAAL